MMKQSRSRVDNEIGSVRAPTTMLLPCPLKLTGTAAAINGPRNVNIVRQCNRVRTKRRTAHEATTNVREIQIGVVERKRENPING